MAEPTDAVTHYAARLHAALDRAGGAGHQRVTSPLGAWLVLALAAPVLRGDARAEVEDALGVTADRAAELAGRLLAEPHPAVVSAAALWLRRGTGGSELTAWQAGLPEAVAHGDVPDQSAADAWTRDHTLGLIDRFPVELGPDVLLVLTSAVATRVSWDEPFDLVPAFGHWQGRVVDVLHAEPGPFHRSQIVATRGAGDVAVHTATAREGLAVTSVIAAAEVAPADVLAVAHEIATTVAGGAPHPDRRSLFDLPLGDAPLWTVAEADGQAEAEHVSTSLPAWTATSGHDLLADPATGFPAATAGIGALIDADRAEAVQQAVARYGRVGFEAAAVTAMAFRASARLPPRRARRAQLRFAHPHAVVATATHGGLWDGVPVFAAWVADPAEP